AEECAQGDSDAAAGPEAPRSARGAGAADRLVVGDGGVADGRRRIEPDLDSAADGVAGREALAAGAPEGEIVRDRAAGHGEGREELCPDPTGTPVGAGGGDGLVAGDRAVREAQRTCRNEDGAPGPGADGKRGSARGHRRTNALIADDRGVRDGC